MESIKEHASPVPLHSQVRNQNNTMEVTSAAVFLNVVNSFIDADQLMDFAATWGIQKGEIWGRPVRNQHVF